MKRNESNSKGRRNSVSIWLNLLFVCSLLLFVSTKNITIMGEGFFIIDKMESSLLTEGERGKVLCAQDGFLYLYVTNSSQTVNLSDCLQVVDFRQPENPIFAGRYEIAGSDYLVDFKIVDSTAYLLLQDSYTGGIIWTITLLNITEPANPVLLGSSAAINTTSYRVDLSSWHLSIYQDYTYVSTDFEMLIFDCSNPALPVKVANYSSSGGILHVKNDLLYLVSAGVKIFELIDPVNPMLIGEVNGTKHTPSASDLHGNYVITTFWWFGLRVYNCIDPYHPAIFWDYDFPDGGFDVYVTIRDMVIVNDKLFVGGYKLYIFDLSNPQKLKRPARINIGDRGISSLAVSESHVFLTIRGNIIIYSYVENFLARNFFIGIGMGLSVVVGATKFIKWKKKKG